jgi:molybdopterin-guanine dinucleotide biosynthesis protein A
MSAIILAGGGSTRFGQNKGLIKLIEKPLILHALDKISSVVDNTVIVVKSKEQKKIFKEAIKRKAEIIIDKDKRQTPLVGSLAGFKVVQNEYALLLPCDAPFLSIKILKFLLEICGESFATIPKWPNSHIEPLHAVYHVKTATKAIETALNNGKLNMRSMISNMYRVRYISTLILQKFDPQLQTFFNINTVDDLKKAVILIKRDNREKKGILKENY